jgi:hypothetical protein
VAVVAIVHAADATGRGNAGLQRRSLSTNTDTEWFATAWLTPIPIGRLAAGCHCRPCSDYNVKLGICEDLAP